MTLADRIEQLDGPDRGIDAGRVTPEMVASLGGEDQNRSFLAALFIVQAELEQAD